MDNRMICSYIRLSEEDIDKEGNEVSASILNQIQYIEEYAKDNNLVISKNYIDDGYTGINYDRPAFEQMKKDIDSGNIATIITKDFSRLGREYIETGYYITQYFPENNVRYVAINDNYDSNEKNSPLNDIMVGVKSLINDRYIKDTSIKIKEIKRQKTEKGFYMGFIAPYGYIKVKKDGKITLDIDHEASKIVKRIFNEIVRRKIKERSSRRLK